MKTTAKISRSTFAAMNYTIVRGPGKYKLVAGNTNRIYDEKLGKYKHIVNLRAITEANEPSVKGAFGDKTEIEIQELNGLTMSHNIIENEGQTASTPMNGETVEAIVDWVDGREGKVLAVKKMLVAKAIEAEKFSFDEAPASSELKDQSISATGLEPEKAKAETEKKNTFV